MRFDRRVNASDCCTASDYSAFLDSGQLTFVYVRTSCQAEKYKVVDEIISISGMLGVDDHGGSKRCCDQKLATGKLYRDCIITACCTVLYVGFDNVSHTIL